MDTVIVTLVIGIVLTILFEALSLYFLSNITKGEVFQKILVVERSKRGITIAPLIQVTKTR